MKTKLLTLLVDHGLRPAHSCSPVCLYRASAVSRTRLLTATGRGYLLRGEETEGRC